MNTGIKASNFVPGMMWVNPYARFIDFVISVNHKRERVEVLYIQARYDVQPNPRQLSLREYKIVVRHFDPAVVLYSTWTRL